MFNFLKNALLRGLVVLIPVVLVYLTIRELFEAMVFLATPIADFISSDWIQENDPTRLIALVLIVLVALILGLIWSAKPTRRAAEWLESRTLNHLPMYKIMKSLVGAFLNLEDEDRPQTTSAPYGLFSRKVAPGAACSSTLVRSRKLNWWQPMKLADCTR